YQVRDALPIYALEGSVAVTGSAVQWLRDQLGIIRKAEEIEAMANRVADNGGVYFVPAFSGLYAPHWRSDARGCIVGLSRFNDKGHLARATLDAICYQTRDVLDAMVKDSGVKLEVLKVDGGATANNTLMQLQADILGVAVVRPVVAETTALGAAYAAGLAVGFWSDAEEMRRNWQADKQWEPRWSEDQRVAGYVGWQKAIERKLNWVDVGKNKRASLSKNVSIKSRVAGRLTIAQHLSAGIRSMHQEKSAKRTTEILRCFSRPFHGLGTLTRDLPALKCGATINRRLRRLKADFLSRATIT